MDLIPGDLDSLYGFIVKHTATYNFKGHKQKFLPKEALDQASQRNIIEAFVLQSPLGSSLSDVHSFVDQVHSRARKLFLTCIYSDLDMSLLKGLIENELTDNDLPLSENDCPNPKDQRGFESRFLNNQGLFNPVIFNMNSVQVLDDACPIPIDLPGGLTCLLGKGAFGEVYRIKIHKDCYSFDESNDQDTFAVKVIQHEASSDREKKFNSAMADLKHPNLVKCLSSFTFGSDTYLIYPLAEGNLDEYMEQNKSLNTGDSSQSTEAWFADQLRGLAAALLVVHDQKETPTARTHLDVQAAASGKTGYVHDIKPENILVVGREGQMPLFRLSDFSCAKVVDFVTSISGQRNTHLTVSKSGTPNYRPPESQSGKTSRPYDLWSLGCVYLELLTWYLEDYEALEQFRDDREGHVSPDKQIDQGFYEADGNGYWRLREVVTTKLDVLRPKCQGPLKEILDVIPDLLTINAKERITAAELVRRLPSDASGTILLPVPEPKRRDSMLSVEGSPENSPRPRRALPVVESPTVSGGLDIKIKVRAPTTE